MTTALPSLSSMLQRSWWVLLVRGLAAIAFGVLTWMQPGVSTVALLVIFGAYVFVDGVLGVYAAIKGRQQSRHWWVILIWGLVGVLVGVMTFINPTITGLVLTIYIGVWAIITGVMQIIAALRLRKEIEGEWLLILSGLISVIFGGFVISQPLAGMMAMVWVIATYAVIFGVLMVVLAFRVKKGISL